MVISVDGPSSLDEGEEEKECSSLWHWFAAFPWSYEDPVSPSLNSSCSTHPPRHQRSPSQSAIPVEQPAWLEVLLDDPYSSYKGIIHRRSASDSLTLLDGIAESLPALNTQISEKKSDQNDGIGKLDLDWTYGPNSPRHKANSASSESNIVSALEEYISNTDLHLLDGSLYISGMTMQILRTTLASKLVILMAKQSPAKNLKLNPELITECFILAAFQVSSFHAPTIHHMAILIIRQRSRILRLQYIAGLERIVKSFESEMVVRAGNLLQQRAALTIKNTYLKQQIVKLQQEKLLREGKHQSLKREAENIKIVLARSSNTKSLSYFEASPTSSEATWKSLGLEKLSLN